MVNEFHVPSAVPGDLSGHRAYQVSLIYDDRLRVELTWTSMPEQEGLNRAVMMFLDIVLFKNSRADCASTSKIGAVSHSERFSLLRISRSKSRYNACGQNRRLSAGIYPDGYDIVPTIALNLVWTTKVPARPLVVVRLTENVGFEDGSDWLAVVPRRRVTPPAASYLVRAETQTRNGLEEDGGNSRTHRYIQELVENVCLFKRNTDFRVRSGQTAARYCSVQCRHECRRENARTRMECTGGRRSGFDERRSDVGSASHSAFTQFLGVLSSSESWIYIRDVDAETRSPPPHVKRRLRTGNGPRWTATRIEAGLLAAGDSQMAQTLRKKPWRRCIPGRPGNQQGNRPLRQLTREALTAPGEPCLPARRMPAFGALAVSAASKADVGKLHGTTGRIGRRRRLTATAPP